MGATAQDPGCCCGGGVTTVPCPVCTGYPIPTTLTVSDSVYFPSSPMTATHVPDLNVVLPGFNSIVGTTGVQPGWWTYQLNPSSNPNPKNTNLAYWLMCEGTSTMFAGLFRSNPIGTPNLTNWVGLTRVQPGTGLTLVCSPFSASFVYTGGGFFTDNIIWTP